MKIQEEKFYEMYETAEAISSLQTGFFPSLEDLSIYCVEKNIDYFLPFLIFFDACQPDAIKESPYIKKVTSEIRRILRENVELV